MKTLVGIVTFGNLPFTIQTIRSLVDYTPIKLDYFVVIGKPGDRATIEWMNQAGIPNLVHTENKGFPASLNDIFDYAWKQKTYDNLIIAGNDVIAYPYTMENILEVAKETDYEAISTTELNVKTFTSLYPESRKYFKGQNYLINNLSNPFWLNYRQEKDYGLSRGLIDIHNLCLYKRSVFEKVGYNDVSYFPAYFEDNDYVRRMGLANIKDCTISSKYFHFWSRTVHQEVGGSNNKYFEANKKYYITKWGGEVGSEKFILPFNGQPHILAEGITLKPTIKIEDRFNESAVINYWRNK